jgi:hypothetical protein
MSDIGSDAPFRFRVMPVVVACLVGFDLPYIAQEIVDTARHYSHLVPGFADKLGWLMAQHTALLILTLIAIWIAQRVVPADYGMHMPREKAYVLPAILWGAAFGILLALVHYAPSLLTDTAPKLGYPPTVGNLLGWLGFNGLYDGATEEPLFRALLVTYLTATMPGKWRVGGYEMNAAGVIAAVIYAIYAAGFFTDPWLVTIGQFACQFAFGVLLAYWLEKSKSVLAPVIGHNVCGAILTLLPFVLVMRWG